MSTYKNIKSGILSGVMGITTVVIVALASIYVDVSLLRPERKVVGASMAPNIMPGSIIDSSIFFREPERNGIYLIDETMLPSDLVSYSPGDYIKRVIGMPGDELSFEMKRGRLIAINGVAIKSIRDPNLKTHSIRSKTAETKGTEFDLVPYATNVEGGVFHIYESDEKAMSTDPKMQAFTAFVFNYPWLKGIEPKNGIVTFSIPEDSYFVLSDNRVMGTDSRHFGPVPKKAFAYKYVMN